MNDLKGKRAVITGGGGGIGRAIACSLAKEGASVALLGGNNREKLLKTAEIAREGNSGNCLIFGGNLADFDFLKKGLEAAVTELGGLDILINNAGMALNRPFEETSREDFENIMKINVEVPYFLTQQALPYLKKSSAASIINVASVVAHAGYPLQSAYTASKHALLGFTKSLAAEVFGDGIRVHAISPGGVYTDMVKIARPDLTDEGMILPQDIAEIVMFFLKNRGNAVIDEIIVHRVNKQPFLV